MSKNNKSQPVEADKSDWREIERRRKKFGYKGRNDRSKFLAACIHASEESRNAKKLRHLSAAEQREMYELILGLAPVIEKFLRPISLKGDSGKKTLDLREAIKKIYEMTELKKSPRSKG
jgi:hypothetical protein